MTRLRSMTAIVALGAALAAPAFAQTPSTTGTAASPMAPVASRTSSTANSDYMTASQDVRASKVIGASVYNDRDEKIGTINELLMDPNHDVKQAVLSVGGFLGVDSKLVAVNIDSLQMRPDRIVMTGATKDGLTKMPTYSFAKS